MKVHTATQAKRLDLRVTTGFTTLRIDRPLLRKNKTKLVDQSARSLTPYVSPPASTLSFLSSRKTLNPRPDA